MIVTDRRTKLTELSFFVPATLLIGAVVLIPIVNTIWLSFHQWSGFGDPSWTGLRNYRRLFGDEIFLNALRNNGLVVLFGASSATIIGLVTALMVNRGFPAAAPVRSVVFLPAILPMVVVSLLWVRVYAAHGGLLNQFLELIGLTHLTRGWLSSRSTALAAVIVVWVWKHFGHASILFLAAVQGIPTTYAESARIEGASELAIDFRIVLPLLRPTIIIVGLWAVILGFKIFALVFVMTGGGPNWRTEVANTYLYRHAFRLGNLGLASAAAGVTLAILITFGIARRFFKREIEY